MTVPPHQGVDVDGLAGDAALDQLRRHVGHGPVHARLDAVLHGEVARHAEVSQLDVETRRALAAALEQHVAASHICSSIDVLIKQIGSFPVHTASYTQQERQVHVTNARGLADQLKHAKQIQSGVGWNMPKAARRWHRDQ